MVYDKEPLTINSHDLLISWLREVMWGHQTSLSVLGETNLIY